MAGSGVPAFSLRVGPWAPGELTVDSFVGREGLSRLYDFQIDFHPLAEEPLEAAELLGTEAVLTLEVPGGSLRFVHGKVRSVHAWGCTEAGGATGSGWCPSCGGSPACSKSRIFQGQAVPDILTGGAGRGGRGGEAVAERQLRGARVLHAVPGDGLRLPQPADGVGGPLLFLRAHGGGAHAGGGRQALGARAAAGRRRAAAARDGGRTADGEYLSSTASGCTGCVPATVHLKDYDFEKPALDVSGKAQDSSDGPADLEVYDYPGEYVAPGGGQERREGAAGGGGAGGAHPGGRGRGSAASPRATASRWRTTAPTRASTWWWRWCTRASSRRRRAAARRMGKLYRNQFQCMPAQVPFRPRRLTPSAAHSGGADGDGGGPCGRGDPHRRARPHQGAVPLGSRGPAGRQVLVLGARGPGLGRPGVGRAVPAAHRPGGGGALPGGQPGPAAHRGHRLQRAATRRLRAAGGARRSPRSRAPPAWAATASTSCASRTRRARRRSSSTRRRTRRCSPRTTRTSRCAATRTCW